MWELDHKECWVPKNWCFRTVVLEKTLQSPSDSKQTKPVNPKGNQPWVFIGRADSEAPILWPSDAKNWLIGKDPDAGKDWRQEEKGTTEDEMVGWHHWLSEHEFEQTPGDSERQGSLECCSPGDSRVGRDFMTEQQQIASYISFVSFFLLLQLGPDDPRWVRLSFLGFPKCSLVKKNRVLSLLEHKGFSHWYLMWGPGWTPQGKAHNLVGVPPSSGPSGVFNTGCRPWASGNSQITVKAFLAQDWLLW